MVSSSHSLLIHTTTGNFYRLGVIHSNLGLIYETGNFSYGKSIHPLLLPSPILDWESSSGCPQKCMLCDAHSAESVRLVELMLVHTISCHVTSVSNTGALINDGR